MLDPFKVCIVHFLTGPFHGLQHGLFEGLLAGVFLGRGFFQPRHGPGCPKGHLEFGKLGLQIALVPKDPAHFVEKNRLGVVAARECRRAKRIVIVLGIVIVESLEQNLVKLECLHILSTQGQRVGNTIQGGQDGWMRRIQNTLLKLHQKQARWKNTNNNNTHTCDNPSPDVRIGARIDCALGKLSLIDGSRMSP